MLGLVLALSVKHSSICWPYLLNPAPYVGTCVDVGQSNAELLHFNVIHAASKPEVKGQRSQ